MTRPLSPDSARIANDLIDQHYGADAIAGTVNNMRRQEGQNSLPAYGQAYAGWVRTHHPANPTPYGAQDVREFRRNHPSASMPPALAGLPARPSNLSRQARSGDAIPGQFPTSRRDSRYLDPAVTQAQASPIASTSAESSSAGAPQRRAARRASGKSPYPPTSSMSSGSHDATTARARPSQADRAPTLPEHIAMMNTIPAGTNRHNRSNINRFLCHLEQQDTAWSRLLPAEGSLRPMALEQMVNASIKDHQLDPNTRSALNYAFGLILQSESKTPALTSAEHIAMISSLPSGVSQPYRSSINRFLLHLEQQGTSWSQLMPADGNTYPAALEDMLNTGIREHGLSSNTRAAIRQAFNLILLSDREISKLKPVFPEHAALMAGLPQELSQTYRSRINRFFIHLELQGNSWSELVPAGSGARPVALEQTVNAGISSKILQSSTRTALNQAFGLSLQSESGIVKRTPIFPEHTALMRGLPQQLSQQYRSNINLFLCHLEQQDSSWSQLVPNNSSAHPAALERAINDGIYFHGLNSGTRAAFNQGFGYDLRPPMEIANDPATDNDGG